MHDRPRSRNRGIRPGDEAAAASVLVLAVGLLVLVAAVSVAAYLAGRPVALPQGADVSALEGDVRNLRSENARLTESLAGLALRLGALESEVARRSEPAQSTTAGSEVASSPEPGTPAAAPGLEDALETEKGKAALEKTVEGLMEQREKARFARAMGIDLATFPSEANLTEEQTAALTKLLGRWQDKVRETMDGMRGLRGGPEVDRETRRATMRETMGTLQAELVQEAATFLDSAQLSSFESQLQMPGPGGGGGGRRGGR